MKKTHNLKSARLQARRRKAVIGRIFILVFFVSALWGSIYFLTGLSFVTVREIEVVGATSIATSTVSETAQNLLTGRYFYTIPKSNIFFYPKNKIERAISDAYPRVEHVGIGFKNFHAITVTLIERSPKALWCDSAVSENCYFLDDQGLIFSAYYHLDDTAIDFIKFYSASAVVDPINHQFVSSEYFAKLIDFAGKLKSVGFTVLSFSERQDADFEVKLSGGQRIIFSKDANFDTVLQNFKTLLGNSEFSVDKGFKRVDYLDLRFGNKVFYKTK